MKKFIIIMLTSAFVGGIWATLVYTADAPKWAIFMTFGIIYNGTDNHLRK